MAELMNFQDAREYLKTSRATLYRLIQGKRIPAFKIGGRWRFDRERLDKWFTDHENIKMKIEDNIGRSD